MTIEESKCNKILTHIDVLDKLLGLVKDQIEILGGKIILIRGEPGSGKTTLGLQILSENLRSIREECNEAAKKQGKDTATQDNNKQKVAFFSLETDPGQAIEYTKDKYGFFKDGDDSKVIFKSVQDIQKAIKGRGVLKGIIRELDRSLSLHNISSIGGIVTLIRMPLIFLFEYGQIIITYLCKTLRKFFCKTEITEDNRWSIIFVDSLSVFIQLLQKNWRYKDIPERLLLNELCEIFRKKYDDSIIIFSGEYHFKEASKNSIVSESFFCDIEITLFTEPIVVPRNYESQYESPLGSNSLTILKPKTKNILTQSFCRVQKSRKSPNQTRRCAYDIVVGTGLKFYETYPGDGHLTLFSENKCQEDAWKILFEQSLPHLYPSLRYDSFDRGSLQRISAAQRRFRYIPQRTDAYISSFDNYWINWYSEMCLKANIADVLKRELGVNDAYLKADKARLKLVNNIHSALSKTRNQLEFGRDIHKETEKFLEKMLSICDTQAELPACKDLFDDFLSGLLNKFSRSDESDKKADKTKNINRPCLRCLWDRSLLWKLYEEYGKEDENFLQNCRDFAGENSSEPDDQFYKLVKEVINTCKNSQNEKCRNKIEIIIPSVDKSSFEKFINDKEEKCDCKLIIKEFISEFIENFKKEYIEKNIKNPSGIPDFTQLTSENKELSNEILESLKRNVFRDIFSDARTNNPVDLIKDGLDCFSDKLNGNRRVWVTILGRLFFEVLEKTPRYRLISPIREDKLRLYGERRSEIIKEMESHHPDTRRPVHRQWNLFSLRDQNSYSSVPYDANISFLVYRKDLLDKFYDKTLPKNNEFYKKLIEMLVARQYELLDKLLKNEKSSSGKSLLEEEDSSAEGLIDELINKSKENRYPTTWEEIIAFYLLDRELEQDNPQDKKQNANKKVPEEQTQLHFLIETRSPDTYLCTMLEFIWSCGANLRIFPDYTIDQEPETRKGIIRAFYLIGLMFQYGIIPRNSTLEVNEFAKIYGQQSNKPEKQSKDKQPDNKQQEWVFARHWYSTLVDILSAPLNKGSKPITDESDYLWQQSKADLGLMPIPVSFSNYAKYKNNAWHISCWGDWHLALISDSENIELGSDLINELMGSDRICERAETNASIPTVEEFYNTPYKNKKCLNFPIRKKIIPPDWTYQTLREELFKHAKSRSQIFDYHHCIRELHSIIEFIRLGTIEKSQSQLDRELHSIMESISSGKKEEPHLGLDYNFLKEIYENLNKAFETINTFAEKPFLMS
ncbi:MAG: hypothetical protein WC374_00325 [Phycisphaerae bacterium]|jgi:hypothetical protein